MKILLLPAARIFNLSSAASSAIGQGSSEAVSARLEREFALKVAEKASVLT
jgi:hypothetical protein